MVRALHPRRAMKSNSEVRNQMAGCDELWETNVNAPFCWANSPWPNMTQTSLCRTFSGEPGVTNYVEQTATSFRQRLGGSLYRYSSQYEYPEIIDAKATNTTLSKLLAIELEWRISSTPTIPVGKTEITAMKKTYQQIAQILRVDVFSILALLLLGLESGLSSNANAAVLSWSGASGATANWDDSANWGFAGIPAN